MNMASMESSTEGLGSSRALRSGTALGERRGHSPDPGKSWGYQRGEGGPEAQLRKKGSSVSQKRAGAGRGHHVKQKKGGREVRACACTAPQSHTVIAACRDHPAGTRKPVANLRGLLVLPTLPPVPPRLGGWVPLDWVSSWHYRQALLMVPPAPSRGFQCVLGSVLPPSQVGDLRACSHRTLKPSLHTGPAASRVPPAPLLSLPCTLIHLPLARIRL